MTVSVESENLNIDFKLTEFAAEKVQAFMQQEDEDFAFLRLMVQPGGCSGFSYALEFETEAGSDDVVFEQNGVKILVDKYSSRFADGVSIDYVNSLQGSGFKIDNSKAASSCGCGSSFGF